MEWDGHVEIEIVVAPSGAVPTAAEHGPVPACASDGCGPCTDVLIEMPFQTAHRSAGELHAVDPPEQPVSDLAYQPSTECKIPGDLLRLPLSVVSAALCADGRVPFLLL